jgi:hypothetical protein
VLEQGSYKWNLGISENGEETEHQAVCLSIEIDSETCAVSTETMIFGQYVLAEPLTFFPRTLLVHSR